MLSLTIHRGAKEIGGSCVEISSDNSRILLDFGMPLLEPSLPDNISCCHIDHMISSNILPNIKDLYSLEKANPIDGILISHPHYDHYGLSNFIRNDAVFYLGEATLDIINITSTFTNNKIKLSKTKCFKKSEQFQIGGFRITPFWNDHSAFDAYSFLIEAEGKKIFYSGDFRKHGRKEKVFYWLKHNAPEGIDYLILEGTNIGHPDKITISEKQIEEELVKTFKSTDKTNFIYTSGQNIDRLVSIFRACRRTNKLFVIDFYIATILKHLSKYASLPFPDPKFKEIKVIFPYSLSTKFRKENNLDILYQFKQFKITKNEISNTPGNIVMIVRPSMQKDIGRIKNIDGGNLIYSLWEGYLEKEYTKKFISYLEQERNFKVIKLHTSGHADLATLKEYVNILKPKKIIPIHTFESHNYIKHFNFPIMELKDGVSYTV